MPTFHTSIAFGGYPVLDPKPILESLEVNGYGTEAVKGKANSLSLPRGCDPGSGHLLMYSADFDRLAKNQVHSLQLQSFDSLTIHNLIITGWQSIGGPKDLMPRTVLLVDVADIRHLGKYLSGSLPYPAASNVQTPDYNDSYYASTDTASWQALIERLWIYVPSSVPNPSYVFASFPTKRPQGFDFQGWSVWKAIECVLNACEHTLVFTPSGDLYVVALGDDSTLPANALDNYNDYLFDDTHYSHNPAAFLGANLIAHFEAHDYAFQQSSHLSEATPKSYRRHRTIKDVSSSTGNPSAFGGSYSHHYSAQKARYDTQGVIQNQSDLTSEAATEAASRLQRFSTKPRFNRVYKGWHDIPVLFDGFVSIHWWDYGYGSVNAGSFTEIVYGPFSSPRENTEGEDYRYPGPPDLSVAHMEEEYLAVGRPNEVIKPRDARDTFFRYGTPVGTSPNDLISWADSNHYTRFHTLGIGNRVFLPGDQYPALWHQQVRKWLLLDGEQIVLCKASEVMHPGSCCYGSVVYDADGTFTINQAQVILQDVGYHNFLTTGDLVWCRPVGTTSDGFMVLEIIGEHGLHQSAKALADTLCDESGTFRITFNAPTKTPYSLTISTSTGSDYYTTRKAAYTTADCGSEQYSIDVTACARKGHSRMIFEDEYVDLFWNAPKRRWEWVPKPLPLLAMANLQDDMCQTGDTGITDVTPIGVACGTGTYPTTDTANNFLNLKGRSGSKVIVLFDGEEAWYIINVYHQTVAPLTNLGTANPCDGLTYIVQSMAAQVCTDPTSGNLPLGTELTVVTNVYDYNQGGVCKIKQATRTVRVLCAETPDTDSDVIEFTLEVVMTNVYDDGQDISACFVEVYVACAGDEWCEPVILVDPCDTGSSSGQ